MWPRPSGAAAVRLPWKLKRAAIAASSGPSATIRLPWSEQRLQLAPRGVGFVAGARRRPAEERIEGCSRRVRRTLVSRRMSLRTGREVAAEVRALLIGDLVRHGLATALRDAGVVVGAHAADVQLGATVAALRQPCERHGQVTQRGAAAPADELVIHVPVLGGQSASRSRAMSNARPACRL